MIKDIVLVAVIRDGNRTDLLRIPLHSSLIEHLKHSWSLEYEEMSEELDQVDFVPGYQLKRRQCFRLLEYRLPIWLAEHTSQTITSIDEISKDHETYNSIQGAVAFTRNEDNDELMLFQDLSLSKVINPGRFFQLDGDVYRTTKHHGFLFDRQLSASYLTVERNLLFRNFRGVNSFLPVFDFYKQVSEQEIRDLLSHSRLITEDIDYWAKDANQWFRTRFTRLRNSGILDRNSAKEIAERSNGYDIPIQVVDDRIVFPSDNASAKKILRFLNEEYFKGAITDKVYETNSKKTTNG